MGPEKNKKKNKKKKTMHTADAFTINVCWNFDKMQIIFKAITGSSGHAPWWKGYYGTVRAREESGAKSTELVAALGSSLH